MNQRVLLADDQHLLRAGISGILNSASDIQVVGEADNGEQAVELARTLRPDAVLMDIRMPVLDGIEATRHIITAEPQAKILILTTFDLDEYVYEALRAGASGFLLKDTPPRRLIEAVRAVTVGDTLLAPTITKRLITRFTARPPTPTSVPKGLAALTDREREVLTLVAGGLTNDEVARQLHIAPGTAKTHVRNLLTKLDARDRVHLVIIAYRTGLAEG
ncbi:response regulator transcription factor [Streptomyces sp. NPDC013172]|uniref:response regulator transcription factor n=1 Tax=Streptomyces sp. NPDC013172 TaxID=3155009 RepID=UPI0033DF67E4